MLRTARVPLAAFLLLCLLGALGPLRNELAPSASPSAFPPWLLPAWPYLLAALLAATYALLRRLARLPTSRVYAAVCIGLGLFVVPTVVLLVVQSWIDPFTQVILLALTPVFTIVLEPHIAPSFAQPRHALVASIGAASGLLLIFPFQLPGTTAAAAAWLVVLLTVCIVAAAYCRAVQLASQLSQKSSTPLAAIACAVSAGAFVLTGIVVQTLHLPLAALRAGFLWSALVDTPGLLLLFWLLPRLSASRLTTRFILSPFFSSLVALCLLRPTVTARDVAGLLFAGAGSAWLLLASASGPHASSSTLGLMEEPPR